MLMDKLLTSPISNFPLIVWHCSTSYIKQKVITMISTISFQNHRFKLEICNSFNTVITELVHFTRKTFKICCYFNMSSSTELAGKSHDFSVFRFVSCFHCQTVKKYRILLWVYFEAFAILFLGCLILIYRLVDC